jgi:hypothetical protein
MKDILKTCSGVSGTGGEGTGEGTKMERGRLYYHSVDGEEAILCEEDGEGFEGECLFKISIVGFDERIELRSLTVENLADLRSQIEGLLKRVKSDVAQQGSAGVPGAEEKREG